MKKKKKLWEELVANSKKKHKATSYIVSYSKETQEKAILTLLKNVGKYLYSECDKLLKAKPDTAKWEWKAESK